MLKDNGVAFIALKQGTGEGFVTNTGKDNLDGAKRYFAYYTREEMTQIIEQANMELADFLTNENRENVWMRFFCIKA